MSNSRYLIHKDEYSESQIAALIFASLSSGADLLGTGGTEKIGAGQGDQSQA